MKAHQNPMPRIAIFFPTLAAGGVQKVMLTLANELADRGDRVDLVLLNAAGPFRSQVGENVRIVQLGGNRVAWSLVRLVRYLRSERPVAFVSSQTHANVVSIVAKHISGVSTRLVVCAHNTVSQRRLQNLRGRAMPFLMRLTYPSASRVVAVSQGVADDLVETLKLDKQLVTVIYNPVVTPAIQELARAPLEHPWLSSGCPPVVVGIGRLTEIKDFQLLIQAFAELRKRRDARLVILGEGEQREELEQLVEQKGLSADVELPGYVPNPYAWLGRAAVFVLSSRSEGLPTVLIEAMACGTRVVSTDCRSGPREILEDGKWGKLVPVGDVGALCNAIDATLSDSQSPDVSLRAKNFDVNYSIDRYRPIIFG
jgi:glycosyltransferase involved in cell wall biosynthesis